MYSRVSSRSKFSFPQVEFGEMPAGRRLLEHAGCVWQLTAMFFLTMALRRLKPEMEWEEVVVFPMNKSAVWSADLETSACQVCHRAAVLPSFLSHHGDGGGVWRDGDLLQASQAFYGAAGEQICCSSFSACRWLLAASPATAMAEWRPLLLLLPTTFQHLPGRHQKFNLQARVPSWRPSWIRAVTLGSFASSGYVPGAEAGDRA
jgi:hypothetical protein